MRGMAVHVFTEDREQQAILQNRVEATHAARIVVSHVGFPLGATDPVMRQMQDQRAEVAIIDVNSGDPQGAIRAVELIRGTFSDLAIFAIGDMRNPMAIVGAMRAGAREFMERPATTRDLREAFIRLSGVRRKAPSESGPSGGSAPPSSSTPPSVPIGVRGIYVPAHCRLKKCRKGLESGCVQGTPQCVLAVPMAPRAGMEAIDRNLLYGGTDLFVLTAAEGYVTTPIQLIAGDL